MMSRHVLWFLAGVALSLGAANGCGNAGSAGSSALARDGADGGAPAGAALRDGAAEAAASDGTSGLRDEDAQPDAAPSNDAAETHDAAKSDDAAKSNDAAETNDGAEAHDAANFNDAARTACVPATSPGAAGANVTVDVARAIRTIPDDLYGYNATVWFGYEDGSDAPYNAILKNAGIKVMRWPGGSWADEFQWNDAPCWASWVVTYAQSEALFESLGIRFQPIVNGSGIWCGDQGTQHTLDETTQLAAAWVQDGALGAKYWEVGNELFGLWEPGAMTGTEYGTRFVSYYQAMKAINPAVKVMAVAVPEDTSCSDCVSDGLQWTADLLAACSAQGVVPDGFNIHSYPSDDNATLLHDDLDAIGSFTTFLDDTVQTVTGKAPLDYAMTEFAISDSRHYEWIGGQFALEYIMEMAKNGWAASNLFFEIYDPSFRAYPSFYVYAFLTGQFGRDMVAASSDNPDVRAYASLDGSDLTVFVANNSTSATTAQVHVANYPAACSGQIWTIEGAAGENDAGDDGGSGDGWSANDVIINGVVHPDESTARTMPGIPIATGSVFDLPLPASSVVLVRVSP